MFFFLSLFKNTYKINTNVSALSEYGKNLLFLHRNQTNVYFSFGFPQEGGFFVPQGTTLESQGEITENDALKWEGHLSTKGKFFLFAPSVTFNVPFVKTIILADIPSVNLGEYSYLNISIQDNLVDLELNVFTTDKNVTKFGENWETIEVQKLPFVYRTLSGDIVGKSNTFIKYEKGEQISIFEPFPDMCKPDISRLSTTCNIKDVKKRFRGFNFVIDTKEGYNCSYSYRYRCSFLKWNEFGQIPEKGFLVGPNIVNSEGKIGFSNIAWINLPTPDFSMIYNTPILIGCIFSSVFAIGVRHISNFIKQDKEKKD